MWGCAGAPKPAPPNPLRGPDPSPRLPSSRYEVRLLEGGELLVEAQFQVTGQLALTLDGEVARFVRKVETNDAAGWAPLEPRGDSWLVSCSAGCKIRYRFALREACVALSEADTAIASGATWIAPPSTWLLHPEAAPPGSSFELQVDAGPGAHFVTGIPRVGAGVSDTFRAPMDVLDDATYAAFGDLSVSDVPAGDTTLQLAVAPEGLRLTPHEVEGWVSASAGAVASYYGGHLPARHTLVLVMKGSGRETRGLTLGAGGPAVLLRASELANSGNTRDDWVLTHELLHANFPDLGRAHSWLSEGLATYLEPIARARVGLVSEAKVWRDMLDGMPQGLPESGDQGLENTRTWGRTYWGGAIFCFVADVTLRERTGNRRSLDDVLRAIGNTGASDQDRWSLQQVLDAGERATGTRVLQELYEALAEKPGAVDLARLFARLGVSRQGPSVAFDDAAELGAIRRAITAPRPG